MSAKLCTFDGDWAAAAKRDSGRLDRAFQSIGAGIQGFFGINFAVVKLAFAAKKFMKTFRMDACVECGERSRCLPMIEEGLSGVVHRFDVILPLFLEVPNRLRVPHVYSKALGSLIHSRDLADGWREDIALLKNAETVHEIEDALKESAPDLKDWRETMDFLR